MKNIPKNPLRPMLLRIAAYTFAIAVVALLILRLGAIHEARS